MSTAATLALIRAAWITLAGMMLSSRVAFQLAGPAAMRTFLDWWKVSLTHRAWGMGALLAGLSAAAALLTALPGLGPTDLVLGLLLIFVLIGDGLLNLLPSSFSRFKEGMQDAWVRRHGATPRANDSHLFGTVNLALGMASAGMAALVILYRPIPALLVAGALLAALLLTGLLIACCTREGRRQS